MTDFACPYCKKAFKKESSVESHKCEKRTRHLNQRNPESRIGFQTFQTFYRTTTKSFNDFADSSYYKAFVRFGLYCVDAKVISPGDYADWLIKRKTRIDDWNKDTVYTAYLVDYLPTEPVGPALTRSIKSAITWSESSEAPSQDWLRYGNINSIAFCIITGRLSGWALYNSSSGQGLLERLSDSPLLQQCWPYIDSDTWGKTFSVRDADRKYAKQILQQAGW